MNLEEKTISSECFYTGQVFKLRKDKTLLPDGKTANRDIIMHNGGVCVVPITDDKQILTVKQYRCPYGEIIEEIPAGKRESKDEDPLECGKRELLEETGTTAEHFLFLGELYPTPGYCDEIIYMYAAWGLSFGEMQPDEDEFLAVQKTPLDILVDKVLKGEIKDSKTQAALLKTKLLLDKGEIKL